MCPLRSASQHSPSPTTASSMLPLNPLISLHHSLRRQTHLLRSFCMRLQHSGVCSAEPRSTSFSRSLTDLCSASESCSHMRPLLGWDGVELRYEIPVYGSLVGEQHTGSILTLSRSFQLIGTLTPSGQGSRFATTGMRRGGSRSLTVLLRSSKHRKDLLRGSWLMEGPWVA